METFSTTDAALAGFRLVREHPRTVAVWGVILLIVSAISNILIIVSGGSDLHPITQWPPKAEDLTQMEGQMQALAPVSLFCTLLTLGAFAIVFTGVYRVLLKPSDKGFAHLRFGRDEVQQFLALLVWGLVMLVAYVGVVLVSGVAVALIRLATGNQDGPTALALLVAMAGVFAFLIYTAVRISFIGVLTFMTGKIDLKGALALTRGRFWPLFGTYLLAFILFVVVNLIIMMLGGMLGLIAGGLSGASQVLNPDMSSLSLLLTPAGMVSLLVVCAMSVLGILVLFAPVPEIYRQLTIGRNDPISSWPVLNHPPEN